MRVAWLLVPVLAVTVIGCGGRTKAGGTESGPTVVLTIANHDVGDRDLAEYVAAVDRLSGGSVRLVVKGNWRSQDSEPGPGTIADVRAGLVDLAKVPVRSLDRLGVSELDGLIAPFLVDGLAVERRVLASRLPARLLPALTRLRVEGVAVLPGELERPFGLERRLLGPSDYRGAVIGVTPAPTTALTFRDLGAVPSSYTPGQLPPWRFAGAALDLAGLAEGGHYAVYGRSSLTANVVFWPRVYTIVGNRTVLDELTDDQRDVLRTAAREAVAPAIARLQAEDRAEATALCGRDRVRFVQATPSQVSALQAAVRPLYASIERDQATRSVVATIATLKRGTTPERPLQCVAVAAPEEAATPLDGTWEMTAPRAEADEVDAGRYRLLLRQGRVVLYHLSPPKWGGPPGGVFTVRGNTVEFRFPDGDTGRYRWNVYRDTLTLRAVPGVSSAPNPTFAPWHRVS